MSYFFSIIIPTFNSAEYIRLALESCVIQTYKAFEVVVIDGVSDDNTLDVVGDFQGCLNLKILSEKDNGIYDAMNKGIQMSRGEILYFLGSDDQLHDETILQEIFNVFNIGRHFDVVYGNVNRFRLGNSGIIEKLAFAV
jgi:glycosyltransferase involved in cell wall biosynthesis